MVSGFRLGCDMNKFADLIKIKMPSQIWKKLEILIAKYIMDFDASVPKFSWEFSGLVYSAFR